MNIQAAVLAFLGDRKNSSGAGEKTLFATRAGDKREIEDGGETKKTIGDQKQEEREPNGVTDPDQCQSQGNGGEEHAQGNAPGPPNPCQPGI